MVQAPWHTEGTVNATHCVAAQALLHRWGRGLGMSAPSEWVTRRAWGWSVVTAGLPVRATAVTASGVVIFDAIGLAIGVYEYTCERVKHYVLHGCYIRPGKSISMKIHRGNKRDVSTPLTIEVKIRVEVLNSIWKCTERLARPRLLWSGR